MKDFPGTPGTCTGLILRISQMLFAAASIATIATSAGFAAYTTFCYLIASMGLQVIWSMGLACLDTYALVQKTNFHHPLLLTLFVAGDWVTGTLSLSAVCSSAGVIVLFDRDLGYCKMMECRNYQMAISLALMSWLMVGVSSIIMFWILAAG